MRGRQVALPNRLDGSWWNSRELTVTGGAGFLGSAVVRAAEAVGATVRVLRRAEHDLRDPAAAVTALAGSDLVAHLAADVGGIGYNARRPGQICHANLLIGANVFEAARLGGARSMVAVGTACSYPAETEPPFREVDLWSGYPEGANAPYAIAKKMLQVLSDGYRREYGFDSSVPILTNLYGPGDNYDPEDSHVVAAMIARFCDAVGGGANSITLWGSGAPSRDLLHVDDAARGVLLCLQRAPGSEPINLSSGRETTIRELAELVAAATDFEGRIDWDPERPDGQIRRSLHPGEAIERLGFAATIGLRDGIAATVEAFRNGSSG